MIFKIITIALWQAKLYVHLIELTIVNDNSKYINIKWAKYKNICFTRNQMNVCDL